MKNIFLSLLLSISLLAGYNKTEENEVTKKINLQFYANLKENNQLFKKNVQETQQKFINLTKNLNTFYEYVSPLTQNASLISGVSFLIPGFESLNSAIKFIAATDKKIQAYTNATKNSKTNIIDQKIKTFLINQDLNSIDEIRNELDLYRIELAELSNDLKKVEEIANSIQKFSIQATQYTNQISNTATKYGNQLMDAVNSTEYGKKLLAYFSNNDTKTKNDNNPQKPIVESIFELEKEIKENSNLILQNMKLADNLSSSLATIKNFSKIDFTGF